MDNIERDIARLLPVLLNFEGDDRIVRHAQAAADHLKALIESDAFRSLNGGMLDLFNVIAAHPKMSDNNRTVAKIILRAVNLDAGYACISHAMICEQSGLGVNAVRGSTRKLIAAGFFKTIRPTPDEWDNGEMALKYVPQFSRLSRPRS